MSALTDEVLQLLERATDEDRAFIFAYLREHLPLHPLEQEWNTTSDAILTAIARSTDLTLRGVRGILAEATFETSVLPEMEREGWRAAKIIGDLTYDFQIERNGTQVRIQVKLQRRERGVPKEYNRKSTSKLTAPPPGPIYVVEVQKTRGGEKNGEKTRPYRFGDFDILAVNLHPATGDWKRFAFTVGSWLLPRPADANLIEIMQPVTAKPDEFWTDDLNRCIEWVLEGKKRRLYSA
jgi:hypothetical protein